MRATELGSPVDQDRQDFTIYSGEWAMGRIYIQRGGPQSMRWCWWLYGVFGKPLTCSPTAMRRRSTRPRRSSRPHWLAWAKLAER